MHHQLGLHKSTPHRMIQALYNISTLYIAQTHYRSRIPVPTREGNIGRKTLTPLQALLQVLDAIQPATRWTADERPNTVAFTPMDVDYNPIRLKSMPCTLYLTHPENPSTSTKYLIRPPRLRSDPRGDAHGAPWWRTAILV